MTTDVVRGAVDTWAGSGKPGAEHPNSHRLIVDADGVRSFIYFKSPVARGATCHDGKVVIYQAGDWSGSTTITLQRITEPWKAGRLNWNNQPASTSTGQVQVTKVDSVGQTAWEFDVTALLQMFADGTPNYGFRISSSSSTRRAFFSTQAEIRKPTMRVEWSSAPAAPTTLVPNGTVVSTGTPVLRCDYTDTSGSTTLAAIQVQIDAADDFGSPDFDSGEVPATIPELDLSDTAYGGLSAGSTTYWRVRVKDGDNLWSDWSDSAEMTRQAKGSLAITNPAADPNDYVEEFTPPITWSHTGTTQVMWRVNVADAAVPNVKLHDTGFRLGDDDSYTLPAGVLRDGRTYLVAVLTFDEYDRAFTPGDPNYHRATREFTVQYNGAVTAPSAVTATQQGSTPGVLLSWTRGTAPDSWTIERDGQAIFVDIDPTETLTSGTSHEYVDWTAAPGVEHEYVIRAEVNGQLSSGDASDTITTDAVGLWVGSPDVGWFVVRGNGITWRHQETAATHTPLNATSVVRRVSAMRGLEGSIEGPIWGGDGGISVDDMEANFWTIKEQPSMVYRLVAGGVNIPVVTGEMSLRPHEHTKPGRPVHAVDLDFWQKGELPFEAQL